MKNKRGFTLVELLGTISLIAIILAIVSVSYINITKHIRLSYYKTLEESVLVAGSEYYAYTSNRPNMFGEEKKVSLAYLVENKYITNVVDKKGNTCSLDDSYITSYKNSSDKTKYYVCLICNSDDYKTSTLECNGSLDYTLKTYLTINDTGREYQEGTWVNKYVKVEYKTLNDIKEAIAKDQSGNIKKCNMTLKNGFRSCTLTLDVSGKYELYGTNGDKITSSITKDISVDKISPSFTIYEDTTRIENKISRETTTDKTTVNINVKDIVDNESKVRSIKYSFGKTEEYVVVDNTKTEFSFTKEIDLGISDLIVVVEDYAGNITKKVVKYEVFNKTKKPTSEFCNNITYNGYEQILTEEAENGYKFINNKGTNAGEYTVSAVLDENYKWEDGTDSDISFVCKIERNPVAKEGTCKTLIYDGTTKALVSGGENITLINNEGKNANSYIVKMNANANYAFTDFSTSKEIVCSIGKKDLIVVANSNQSKTYGSSDPTLTYTYSGNISGETTKFTGSLQRASGEAVGSYLINKGTLALIDNGTFLKNNYNLVFSGSTNFTITTKNISSLTITLDNTTYTYDKTEKRPNVVVKDGSKTLTLNTDYTLSYSNNINAGTAYVNITGIGGYTGSSSKSFVINKRSITVKANNQTINYGSSIAQGTGHITVSNLASGDIITSIKLTQSTTSATTNGVITPSNAIINSGNNNYNITYQNGTLVINNVQICANIYINGASKIGNNTSDTVMCCNSTNGSSCNITLPSITPKSGFTALGYSNDGDNLTSATNQANTNVTIYKPNETGELPNYYAITKSNSRNSYSVTYDLNGATSYTIGGSWYTSSNRFTCYADYAYNGDDLPDECGITLPTITRSGWTVHGWSENSNNESATYSQGQVLTLHDDIDLFAITSKSITLSYNTNSTTTTTDNLTNKRETKVIYNTNGTMFNIPSYDNGKVCRSNGGDKYHGYQLLGLASTASSSNVEFCYGDQIYLESDKTLYLVWQDMYATAVGAVSNNLRLRSGPGTSYSQIASIKKGDPVYIKSANYVWNKSDKHTWYPVIYGDKIGWAAGNTSNNSTLKNLTLKTKPNADSCSYAYSCNSNNKLLSITPSDVVLNITSNPSKRKMQQTLAISNQCGPMVSATSSNSSVVTATTAGLIQAISGSVGVNQTKTATITYKTKYGCTEDVNVLVKNTEATEPDITISVSGDSSTCSGSYIKGATATVVCKSDLPITSYSAKIGSTSYAETTSGNTKTSIIKLSSTGTKTINVSCANAEGSSSASKKVSIKVRNASSSCGCSEYYNYETAGRVCSRCTSWYLYFSDQQNSEFGTSAVPGTFCYSSSSRKDFRKSYYYNCKSASATTVRCDWKLYKCSSYACKSYKTCCHT